MTLALAASLLAVGCVKVEVVNGVQEEISFHARSVRLDDWSPLVTKSSYLDGGSELPANSSFGVFAYDTGTDTWETVGATASPGFMTNVPVKYNGQGQAITGNYSYSPTRYWPSGDTPDKLSFYAYYPYTTGGTSGITSIPDASTTGLGTFGYTVDTTPANQVDFMLTDVFANQLYETNSGVVPFAFYHMLTQVVIKVKASSELTGATVSLENLTIDGVKKDGVLTVATPAKNSTWAISGSLPPVAFTSSVPLSATETTLATLHLLPQEDISGVVTAAVSFKITTTTPDRTIEQSVASIDLSKEGTISWDKGYKVTYTFTVGLDNIVFSADASLWSDASNTIIVE